MLWQERKLEEKNGNKSNQKYHFISFMEKPEIWNEVEGKSHENSIMFCMNMNISEMWSIQHNNLRLQQIL